ncbi:MAG: bifunctional GlcG/HbpS family heme-binding protein/cupin domain-containing protein [Thermoleophilaceae bacterium]
MRTRKTIDTAGADRVIAAAEREARRQGSRVFIAVVDPSGELVALRRTPGAQVASARVAVDKARTAAIFVRPSRDIEAQVSGGRLGALALHGAAALTGGIPLKVGDEVVGAIGTSGETPDEDESISIAGAAGGFETSDVGALTYDGARRAAEAVATVATDRGVAPVAAVVDAYGELVFVWRPDAAQIASVNVAVDKARTAAIYRRPSKDFEDQAAGGRPSALHLARAVPLQGGIPIEHAGEVVGAIGVSGAASADEDQELAVLGAKAAEAAASAPANGHAAYFASDKVRAKFQTGGLLLDKPGYKIDAGRRSGPGAVEVHDHEVDVMHVLSGTATVVAGEASHDLAEGDVLEIPAGVPHQFTDASDPFLYFVVKVAS